jgi:hypothetical protein
MLGSIHPCAGVSDRALGDVRQLAPYENNIAEQTLCVKRGCLLYAQASPRDRVDADCSPADGGHPVPPLEFTTMPKALKRVLQRRATLRPFHRAARR